MTEMIKPKTDYEIGGGWGDRIEIDTKKWWIDLEKDTILRVSGHKTPHPKVGQTMLVECENSWMIFEFTEIDPCDDPRDMFFGEVKPIEQVMKE